MHIRYLTEHNEPSGEDEPTTQTILVVEDDVAIGEFVVQALKTETPYHALLATDGFEALKCIRSIKPALFVLDYQLPSMDGIELYDHLHTTEGLEDVPALLMSATLPTKELEKRQISSLEKPFELEDLLHTIQRLLAQ